MNLECITRETKPLPKRFNSKNRLEWIKLKVIIILCRYDILNINLHSMCTQTQQNEWKVKPKTQDLLNPSTELIGAK